MRSRGNYTETTCGPGQARYRAGVDSARSVDQVVRVLTERGALRAGVLSGPVRPVPTERRAGGDVAVIVDGNVPALSRAIVGEAAALASRSGGWVIALTDPVADDASLTELASWGVDLVVVADPRRPGASFAEWLRRHPAVAVFAPATAAAQTVALAIADAFGRSSGVLPSSSVLFSAHPSIGVLSAAPIPVVTVRAGLLWLREPRDAVIPSIESATGGAVDLFPPLVDPEHRRLADAATVLCVGAGVEPSDYARVEAACERLGAEMCATRKVTDRGWLPRRMHVGSSGHVIAPRLYLLVGASGHAHHRVGIEAAGTICALTDDPKAPVWNFADTGLLGDWRDHLEPLCEALTTPRLSTPR